MKKNIIVCLIVILVIIITSIVGIVVFDKLFDLKKEEVSNEFVDIKNGDKADNDVETELKSETNTNTNSEIDESTLEDKNENKLDLKENEQVFSFDTSYGTVKIIAEKALTPRGFSGASNYIFYIKNNNLYLYNHTGEDELYAEEVIDIYYEGNQSEAITVKLNNSSNMIKESTYLKYAIEQEVSFDTSYGTVKIIAEKALTPRGFSGASNYIFYIKNNNLYLYNHTGEDELYAEEVIDIYYEGNQSEAITVKLNGDYKIMKESLYLNYVN